jgi:RimJ/RimL family protein N-acetyltransferase
MLARDQNLLLQPEVNPSVDLQHLHRCVQLAGAWSSLGGNATLIHGDLPGRLVRQLEDLSINLLPRNVVQHHAKDWKPGWLFVDGVGSSLPVECTNSPGANPDQRWQLAATEEWAEANGTRFQSPDLVITPNDEQIRTRFTRSKSILRGSRYQMPVSSGTLRDSQSNAFAVPSIARKILIGVSEESSFAVEELLTDVIAAASDRTTVDVVGNAKLRDSAAMVNLKKAHPEITIRFWASIERRLQSMAPVHLAIVDREAKTRSLAQQEIAVLCLDGTDGSIHRCKKSTALHSQSVDPSLDRAAFRRSLSRVIRSRNDRQTLVDSAVGPGDAHAADRIARRLATSRLRLEPAAMEDWAEVSRWQCDPESLASALPCGDRDAQVTRNEFAMSPDRRKSQRWMFRSSNGTPIGIASLDPCESTRSDVARVRVLINPTLRNLGYGSALLERVLENTAASDVRQIIFQARSNDQAARRMAAKAGLLPVAPTVVGGVVAHQFAIELKSTEQTVMERAPMQRSA